MMVNALVNRFADVHRENPARPLVYAPGAGITLTASDVWDLHRRYADQLGSLGLGPDQLIISAVGNHTDSVSLLLACRAMGIAVMPVDAGTTLPEILDISMRFGAAALVLPSDVADNVLAGPTAFAPSALRRVSPKLATNSRERRRKAPPDVPLPLGNGLSVVVPENGTPARYPNAGLLKLTSGSTGLRRAALTTDAQLIADGTHMAAAMRILPGETQIAAIPLSHSYGLSSLMMPLLLQGTAFVMRGSFVPHQLPSDARKCGARHFPGVPFMFQYFITHPPAGGWPSCLTQLVSAGARLDLDVVQQFYERFRVKIHSFYGTTETGGIAFDDGDEIGGSVPVGMALSGVTITLLPDRDVPEGWGRVHVQSAAVSNGYADRAAGDGFADGGFLTGDYGAFDSHGRLVLMGRVSSFVNVAGRKVQPEEVEHVLQAMPCVADVRVLAAPDAQRGQQIVACVVPAGSQALHAIDVRRFCAERLAPHKIPRAILFLKSIPLTSRGKTDRAALEALIRGHLSE
jgi:acyl-CoA synthetase (AMP-forming)/AMP-acid ligase II